MCGCNYLSMPSIHASCTTILTCLLHFRISGRGSRKRRARGNGVLPSVDEAATTVPEVEPSGCCPLGRGKGASVLSALVGWANEVIVVIETHLHKPKKNTTQRHTKNEKITVDFQNYKILIGYKTGCWTQPVALRSSEPLLCHVYLYVYKDWAGAYRVCHSGGCNRDYYPGARFFKSNHRKSALDFI